MSFDEIKNSNLKILSEIQTTINKNSGSLPIYLMTEKLKKEK